MQSGGAVSPLWSTQSHDAGIGERSHVLDEDFSSFLNFGDIPLNLPSPFDTSDSNGAHGQTTAMETDFMLGESGYGSPVRNNGDRMETSNGGEPHSSEEFMNMQMQDIEKRMQRAEQQQQQQQQRQRQQQQFVQHHAFDHGRVPPTPTSMELHGSVSQTAMPMHSQMMMDPNRFGTYRDEPMIFTPLVSPAVPPLDVDFARQMADYGMPGTFSPLSSPALTAHSYRSHMANPHTRSPADPSQSAQSPIMNKKGSGRRKSTTSRNPSRVVRESPSMKPQRKRLSAVTLGAPQVTSTLTQHTQSQRSSNSQANTPLQLPCSHEGSSNESVSPEPLPDVLMAPPPPRSRAHSTSKPVNGQSSHTSPVTPALLMKLGPTTVHTEDIPPISMDTSEFLNRDVHISNAPSDTCNGDDMTTPTMNASRSQTNSRTPSLTPSLRPSNSVSGTPRQMSPQETQKPNTKELAPKGSRKRASVSSSPALQPKISPSIKPLLPLGTSSSSLSNLIPRPSSHLTGMSADASTLLLASKSNYQNIVEGNHNHLGLQYPEHLSTNLTSKRTSHKIAEQGRRNRINNALSEMASLLPPSKAGGSVGSDGGTGREATSKASTVELAIDYIKQLKRDLEETQMKLKEAEEKLKIQQESR